MVKKIIFFVFFFYFLTLIQNSFLFHFKLLGIASNLVLITVILINFFERPEGKSGIIAAFLGGFYLDVFSISNELFFGFYILVSLILSLFIKLILRKHVEIPVAKKI